MNDELSKAMDAAMADAVEMGSVAVGRIQMIGYQGGVIYGCEVAAGKKLLCLAAGTTEAEAFRRARLVERAVNGMGSQAARIAELEAFAEEVRQLAAIDYPAPEAIRSLRTCGEISRQALSSKGGA